ncbi:hypothetical protein ACS0TY_002899 [Phlomoides rotata]
MEFSRVDLSDLQDLTESFSNFEIINLVNVQVNNVEQTETQNPASTITGPAGSTSSNTPENPEVTCIVPKPKKRNRARDPFYRPTYSPWGRMFLKQIQPYDVMLNLDIPNFRNIKKLIGEWMTIMKITRNTLEYDKESFISLIELSLTGSVKIIWEEAPAEVKEEVIRGESRADIIDRI